jgi:hypothetical protein
MGEEPSYIVALMYGMRSVLNNYKAHILSPPLNTHHTRHRAHQKRVSRAFSPRLQPSIKLFKKPQRLPPLLRTHALLLGRPHTPLLQANKVNAESVVAARRVEFDNEVDGPFVRVVKRGFSNVMPHILVGWIFIQRPFEHMRVKRDN